ncbi:hypothetical protein RHMOL_Rhmol10G0227700 [Rhododendron molle]|uniref:Uncharacterized protein n=1 Tax=Rhododendron molle TaxID=49168 RepID=A0ACC0M671_RHOML|nr:hypothetical protein RHMOL_Rhmol10G0227700 [Rhododendron molle]
MELNSWDPGIPPDRILHYLILEAVNQVIKGSPAEQAGILPGDVIVECGKKFVRGFFWRYMVFPLLFRGRQYCIT